MKLVEGVVQKNTRLSDSYCLMDIHAPYTAQHADAGQFILLQTARYTSHPLLKMPLAVYGKTDDSITVLYRLRGKKTFCLSEKRPGGSIEVLGPLGNGFKLNGDSMISTAVLIAGGCGIASLYLLAQTLKSLHVKVILFTGAKTRDELIEIECFQSLNCIVNTATEDGSAGFKGNVVEFFAKEIPSLENFAVYASGPESMLKHIARLAKEKSFQAQLSFEAYMACGIGVCRGCAITLLSGYKLCCQKGPVFKANEVV
jgi:dihydroorotate dehydrogenase electron transfer subunit